MIIWTRPRHDLRGYTIWNGTKPLSDRTDQGLLELARVTYEEPRITVTAAATGQTAFTAAWWVCAMAVTTATSKVIYGLRKEVDDVRKTVDEFLLYARPPKPDPTLVDVRRLLDRRIGPIIVASLASALITAVTVFAVFRQERAQQLDDIRRTADAPATARQYLRRSSLIESKEAAEAIT